MIFIGIVVVLFLLYAFCAFWGLLIGGTAYIMSERYKRQQAAAPAEPPSHVHLLTPPQPYDWETDLSGWDRGEELDVDEEL